MNTTPTFPAGKLRKISIDGVATVTTGTLRPEAGFVWRVIEAWAYHDDTVNRQTGWRYEDGAGSALLKTRADLAADAKIFITQDGAVVTMATPAGEIILSNRVYASVIIAGLAAGKKLYIRALVQEFAE